MISFLVADFDAIIGCIEDIVIHEEFQELQVISTEVE